MAKVFDHHMYQGTVTGRMVSIGPEPQYKVPKHTHNYLEQAMASERAMPIIDVNFSAIEEHIFAALTPQERQLAKNYKTY